MSTLYLIMKVIFVMTGGAAQRSPWMTEPQLAVMPALSISAAASGVTVASPRNTVTVLSVSTTGATMEGRARGRVHEYKNCIIIPIFVFFTP